MPRNGKEIDFQEIRRRVLREIQTNMFSKPQYDVVLVDEGQDLDTTAFEILRAISTHITVCIDHKQQIYDTGSSEIEILSNLKLRKRNITLLDAFRCCPYIVTLAAELISDPEEKEFYINQARTLQTEKETPLLYIAANFEEERQRLIEILRARQSKGEKIAILLPQKRQVYGFAESIRGAGLEIETPENMDFTNAIPKIMPYHSAKGLTFDSVLLPRLVGASFPRVSESRISRLLFVGITRAIKWIYLSTCQRKEIAALEKIMPLAARNLLTVQRGLEGLGQGGIPPDDNGPKLPETDDILDVL